jgi:hypothetical protein
VGKYEKESKKSTLELIRALHSAKVDRPKYIRDVESNDELQGFRTPDGD